VDDDLLISLAVTCDQQLARRRTCDTHCSVSVWRIVALDGLCPSVRPSSHIYTATRAMGSCQIFSSAFNTLSCYSRLCKSSRPHTVPSF